MIALTKRIELVKKEIETDFKYCNTLDMAKDFKGITYGYMFAITNFSEVRCDESPELQELVEWWQTYMLPKWREKIRELSR